jgi:hypothetical protein
MLQRWESVLTCSESVVSCWESVASCWVYVVSCWESVVSCWELFIVLRICLIVSNICYIVLRICFLLFVVVFRRKGQYGTRKTLKGFVRALHACMYMDQRSYGITSAEWQQSVSCLLRFFQMLDVVRVVVVHATEFPSLEFYNWHCTWLSEHTTSTWID